MEWIATSLGNTRGSIGLGKSIVDLGPGALHDVEVDGSFTVRTDDGKFADSEDSFIFVGCKVDPDEENFEMSASISARETEAGADQQSGYGIMAVDTIVSPDGQCRHRNHLLVGCFGRLRTKGVRLVGGYTDSMAKASRGRVIDESRLFEKVPSAFDGRSHALALTKTDEGLSAFFDGEQVDVAGCDFLMQQDNQAIYVGLAVARGLEVAADGIRFQTSPGIASHTPEATIVPHVPDYPFSRELLDTEAGQRAGEPLGEIVYVAPDGAMGASGTREDPTSLERVIQEAAPGMRIVMLDGVYKPSVPLVVTRGHGGTIDDPILVEAEHPRKAYIDGSSLGEGLPLCVMDADFWRLRGIVFRNSPLSGLTICGNMNRIENCELYSCGDTGLQIVSRPGAPRQDWPRRNTVRDCDSHGNCDVFRCNADGFGAKLRVGEGNVFYRCIAHHNIDDGFDLYTKSLYGAIEPVELDSCVAYGNGQGEGADITRSKPGGCGFKLGGENQPVAHEVWNCVAFSNAQNGFSSNSNPAGNLHFCTAAANGHAGKDDYKLSSNLPGRWTREGLLQLDIEGTILDGAVCRKNDGTIGMADVLVQRMVRGGRLGSSLGKRKRVLITVESLAGGGAERTACRVASALSERHDVFLLYAKEKPLKRYDIDPAVTVIDGTAPYLRPLPTAIGVRINNVRFLRRRAKLLKDARRRYGIDTTISLLATPNFLNGLCKGGYRIVCERNDPSQKPKRYRLRSIIACELADYAVFQTQRVKGMYSQRVQDKSCIIPNPVSVTCTATPGDARKIVSVGRLNYQKNYTLLIRSFALFRETHPGHSLHIYGVGELQEELEQLAASLGVEDAVMFEGFFHDVHAAIKDAEMFVLSSDFEGMSNALIEAMMMGLPCISTACTGSDELITDGVDGLLVPVGDAEELCAAMGRLAESSELRERLAYHARIRAMDFDIEDVIRKWERIL